MIKTVIIASICSLALLACKPSGAPTMSSSGDSAIDDAGVYAIRGTVMGDTEEMIRQVSPARAISYGNGYMAYSGPIIDGKTILTIEIVAINRNLPHGANGVSTEESQQVDWARPGDRLIIKCVDTKCIALKPGNTASFKCRRNYEALATTAGEAWDADFYGTYEIDYCRLETGVLDNALR